jgi:hypothetical protein
MKRLTILSFILGVLVTPVQAQTQAPASRQIQVQGFNGLTFDRSAVGPQTPYQAPSYQPSYQTPGYYQPSYQAYQAPGYQPRYQAPRPTTKTYGAHHLKKHRYHSAT